MTAYLRFGLAYVVLLGVVQYRFVLVYGDCWYDNRRHEENAEVPTGQPCLNCTCTKSVLLCYLRVCTRLPNPPPAGCILLHRYKSCCPELICSDFHDGGNSVEARADPEGDTDVLSDDRSAYDNACISNGSIYGPGSAMHSSSLCEYCYCLAGKQVCVKPKCLLPIEGCSPIFEETSCCPVRYNCTRRYEEATTAGGSSPPEELPGGCLVDGARYREGSKIIGPGHSACDNCYCLRGRTRCEPLSCAPPLLGCAPVVKPGECCAASYNCNGTLEIEPEPNYGLFPTISKEYSKLRKEVQRRPPSKLHQNRAGTVTVAPFYVLAETLPEPTAKLVYQRSPATYGTTRKFTNVRPSSSSTEKAAPHEDDNYFLISSSSKRRSSSTTFSTLDKDGKEAGNDYLGLANLNILSIVDSLLDGKMNRRVDDTSTTTIATTSESSTVVETTLISTTSETTENNADDTTLMTATAANEDDGNGPMTVTTVLKSTDCIRGNLETDTETAATPAESRTDVTTTTDFASDEPSSDNASTEVGVKSTDKPKIDNSEPPPPPDIEAILNISKHKNREDFDYDYNEPTLPPSLPNLKIIPFVAADALDAKKESPKDPIPAFIEEKIDTGPLEYTSNMFKPPVETEGGFVPKEPLIIDDFYNNVVSVPSITSESNEDANVLNCLSDGQEIAHGTSVPSDSPCVTCTCFYGNVVCQKPACPPPTPGCNVPTDQGVTLCCPNYDITICDEPSPKVPQEAVTVAQGIIAPDPFRDVIKTEPAPNLQSLIGDMVLQKVPPISSTTESFGFDKVLQFIFSGQPDVIEKPVSQTPSNKDTASDDKQTNTTETNDDDDRNKNAVGVGPLKLAGCNIYGRMYRVGRIISELSGPCVECKCTEIGVQCRQLRCTDEGGNRE